jgi:hypothetical protein
MSHSPLSPSARHRWALCPGSRREEAKFPEGVSGPAAIDGTHTHTVLEHRLKGQHVKVGDELTDHEGTFVVDQERIDRVKVALDYINTRGDELTKLYGYVPLVLSERKVDPAVWLGRDDMSGTVDVTIIGNGIIELIDYKDGRQPVEVIDNLQLDQYAYGVLADLKVASASNSDVVRMTIIQPRLKQPVSFFETTVGELFDNKGIIIAQAAATDDPNAPLVPGESQCKYCRAKGSCSALASHVMKEIGTMFQPIETIAQQSAQVEPTTMSDDQIRQVMEAAPLVLQMIDGVKAESLRRLNAGQTIPGLKLVKGRGTRVWNLSDGEIEAKLKAMGAPASVIWKKEIVSPAQAEKMKWGTEEEGKALSTRQIERMKKEYISTIEGKLTVALESDDRPAVIMNAAPMFGAVDPEAAPAAPSLPSWLS